MSLQRVRWIGSVLCYSINMEIKIFVNVWPWIGQLGEVDFRLRMCWKYNTAAPMSVQVMWSSCNAWSTASSYIFYICCWNCSSQARKTCFVVPQSVMDPWHHFGILEVCTKTEGLGFRRAKLSFLRAQLGGILWEDSLEDEGTSVCWGCSRMFSWKHKNIHAF